MLSGSVFSLGQILSSQMSIGESVRVDVPLLKHAILSIDPHLFINFLLEPFVVLRLSHHNLESCAGAIQVVVDGVHKLFSRVNILALLGWLVAAGCVADAFLDALRLLDIGDRTDSTSQRIPQIGIGLLDL